MSQDGLRAGGAVCAAGRCIARAGAALLMLALVPAPAASEQLPAPPPPAVEGPVAEGATLPPPRSVLDRHLEAIGGRDAVQGHDSTHAKGTFSIPASGISGTLDAYAARPNRSLIKVTLEGLGDVTEAFDGTTGWSVSPLTGPMLLEGRQFEEKRFDADYESELRSDTRYASITTVEKTQFDGRECYKVRLVRTTGGEDIEFYDVETGLKAGSITTRETPMGTVTATTIETDYRRFGRLLQATTIRSRVGGVEQVITITSIEYDTVQPSVFAMPPAIEALLR
jgi:hypothetical protein